MDGFMELPKEETGGAFSALALIAQRTPFDGLVGILGGRSPAPATMWPLQAARSVFDGLIAITSMGEF